MSTLMITAATTDDEIGAPVRAARSELAAAAAEAGASQSDFSGYGATLVVLAQAVRDAEAVARVQHAYRGIIGTPSEKLSFLFSIAAASDDTWSGRGNDSRRAERDAVVAWVKSAASALRYGAL